MKGRGYTYRDSDPNGINWGDAEIQPGYEGEPFNHYERHFTLQHLDINALAERIKREWSGGHEYEPINPALGDYKIGHKGTLWVWIHSAHHNRQQPGWHIIPNIATIDDLFKQTDTWQGGYCYRCDKKVPENHYCQYEGIGYANL